MGLSDAGRLSMEDKIPYPVIQRITNNYDKERILGSGAFGTVYKGAIQNGEAIAVKVFHAQTFDDTEFQKEFVNLKRLKHQNIVELISFCNDTEEVHATINGKQVSGEKLHMALCLEYVQNGNLGDYISDESKGLEWKTRYEIIKGICEGLKYLHEGINPPILHLDLKPQNILIDKDMIPKVADFGLSRLFGEQKTRKTASACGTSGYVPPEYTDFQVISGKFDIYSLGVIIAKTIVGENHFFRHADVSRKEFINKVHENWRNRLRKTFTSELLRVYCHQVKRCIELALDCVKKNPQERPTIQQIVSILIETETMISNLLKVPPGESFPTRNILDNPLPGKPLAQSSGNKPGAMIELPTYLPFDFLNKITNEFSYKQKLGEDLFRTVYKGILNEGQVITVTRFMPTSPFACDRSFANKVQYLFGFNNHKNIVKTIGYCRESRRVLALLPGRYLLVNIEETLVCHEYLSAGSLAEYIYGESRRLDWSMSFNMIMGICQGLHFLHTASDVPIIHTDLKPENIFLDNNMVAKILDLGQSKHHKEVLKKKQDVLESLVYAAPEYLHGGEVSTRTDIYSLGVTILEIIARGRNHIIKHQLQTGKFIENVHEILAYENIAPTYPSLDACGSNHVKECIEIGLQCIEMDQQKRPTIMQIVDKLNTLSMERQYVIHEELLVQSELLVVQPLELCFPLEPKKPMYCSLQLRNKGDDQVAFMLVSENPERYFFTKLPLCGIVPPSCTYTCNITMRTQPQQTSEDRGSYVFTLHRVAVSKFDLQDLYQGSIAKGYADFFKEAKEVEEVILPVNCHPPFQEPTRSTIEIITARNAQQVSSIDVHPTEPWILTTHKSGHLRVLNYRTMETSSLLEEDIQESVHVAKYIDREKWLVAGDTKGGIHVHSYDKDEAVTFRQAHYSRIASLALHPTLPFLLSSSQEDTDHLIKLWEWDKNKLHITREFAGHTDQVMQVTFNTNSRNTLTSVSLDGTVKIWSIDEDIELVTLDGRDGGLLCVDNFERSNRHHLIAGCKDGTAQIWNMEIKACVQRLEGHAERITAVNLHPELPMLITGSFDGTVRLWNSDTYKLDDIINFDLGQVYAFGFIKDLGRIVVGCEQGIATMEIPIRRLIPCMCCW